MRPFIATALMTGLLAAACSPAAPAPTATPTGPRIPTQQRAIPTADNARVRIVAVQGTSPGGRASATLETTPEALCHAQYTEPQGLLINTPELSTEIADSEGKVTYTWSIRAESRTGPGKLRVNCNGAAATADVLIG